MSPHPPPASRRATLIGAVAIALWATLALLTTASGPVPPFQLVAMTFSVATLLMAGKWIVRGESVRRHLALPAPVWALGIGGLFGFHALYFLALRTAPAVEAGLICYLWPLLIVIFSALLPGERLRWFHVAGAVLGFAGTALLATGGQGVAIEWRHAPGYAAALAAAVVWAAYSVLSRRFGRVPTDSVGGFCAVTAVLGLAAHLAFETTAWPVGWQWLAVLALGLGPVGLAFFAWDHGVKKGDIRVLGALSYATPLASTMLLIVFGKGEATLAVALAAAAIVGGAALAAGDLWRPGKPAPDA
jgi:drug/metabolite transporter (DMT)-like permease